MKQQNKRQTHTHVKKRIVHEDNKIEFSVKLRSIYEHSDYANSIVVKIPIPPNTADVKIFSDGSGKAKYEPEKSSIFWRIKKF